MYDRNVQIVVSSEQYVVNALHAHTHKHKQENKYLNVHFHHIKMPYEMRGQN